MNQGMIAGLLAAFLIPVGLVVCWNFDTLVLGEDPNAPGELLYFYANS